MTAPPVAPPQAPSQAPASPLGWGDYQFLLALARAGSLRAAARFLGHNESTVSRQLARIEGIAATDLFHRVSTGLKPTAAGRVALDTAEHIEAAVAASAPDLPARVRVTAVPIVVNHLLMPAVANLQREQPTTQIELIADQHSLHLGRRDADLALRLARPEHDSTSRCRKLGALRYRTYRHRDCRDNSGFIAQHSGRFALPQQAALADGHYPASALSCADSESVLQAVLLGYGQALLPQPVAQAFDALQLCPDGPTLQREVWLLTRPGLDASDTVDNVKDWLTQTLYAVLD